MKQFHEKLSPNMKHTNYTVVNRDEVIHYPIEFLNSLNPSGLPPHELWLKVGTPVMLLWNLKPPQLCNGMRLQVRHFMPYIIETTILTGSAAGEIVLIPRISWSLQICHLHLKSCSFLWECILPWRLISRKDKSLKWLT